MPSNLVCVLEVGTARTALLAGSDDGDGALRVEGFAEQETTGMRKGRVSDPAFVARAVRTVKESVEAQVDGEIASAALLCSFGDVACDPVRAEVPVAGEDGFVDAADAARAREALRDGGVPPGRAPLGGPVALFYTLDDGVEEVRDPAGMAASRLVAHGMSLHVPQQPLDDLVAAVREGGIDPVFLLFPGLAAASAVLSPAQREDGALCLHLGEGTTCWCAYRNRHPIAAGALPVGGEHVTNDLLSAFRPGSTALARRLKEESGCAVLDGVDPAARVPVPQEMGSPARTVSERAVRVVVNARADETLRLVRNDLEARGVLPWLGAGIVLSGGASRLRGLPELVSRVFGAPCVPAPPLRTGVRALDARAAENAVLRGALAKAVAQDRLEEAARREHAGLRGLFGRLFNREEVRP